MRVLHVLSQRPGRTGSGVTLEAIVREAGVDGHEQVVVVGTPEDDPTPAVADLRREAVHPLRFGRAPLDFPLPGMSDVMPYPSTRWRDLTPAQLAAYRDAWRRHLATVIADFRPDLIHAHHLWVLSALLKDVAPSVPVVVHTHATGLRQMTLCPHLADHVRRGCARNDAFLALTSDLARRTTEALGVPAAKVHVVGAGYREDLFRTDGRTPRDPRAILYVGKYSRAKGLPWLLDAFERLAASDASLVLHVAGGGGSAEAEALARRMDALAPRVVRHGHLEQPALADLMRRCGVFVLPSLYEGLPLVIVEAVASGCRAVGTDLPTVREELAPRLGPALDIVALPALRMADEPREADLPAFVRRLEHALQRALDAGDALPSEPEGLASFTWHAVFERVRAVWSG